MANDPNAKFNSSVQLPSGLEIAAIRKAIEYVERELAALSEIYFEQANVFSAIVGITGTKALDSVSNYEKHKNTDTAQQRFPDLKRKGSGQNPKPSECLESKASKRIWDIQSHFDHPGWYIVWRYLVDETETLKPGCPVVIWRVDVVFLNKGDWKYEPSKAGAAGGGRTHTFAVKHPASRLRGTAIFERTDIVVRNGKAIPKNSH
jgi:hypothetical protein